METLNVFEKFNGIKEYFSPKVLAEVNDVYLKAAIIKGDKIPWHKHENEDELFYIVSGSLIFEEEGKDSFIMNQGDVYVVKRGVEHKVSSVGECRILLIENKTTAHTGDIEIDITKTIEEQLY